MRIWQSGVSLLSPSLDQYEDMAIWCTAFSHLRRIIADLLELDREKWCNSTISLVDPGVLVAVFAETPSYGVLVRHDGEVGAGAKVPFARLDSSFFPGSAHIGAGALIKSIEAREAAPAFAYMA